MLNITEKSEGEAAKDYVLRQLIYNIVHTNLLPGQKLEAPELCSLMNVSNNPLREAELELTQSKLIEIKPKIGRSSPTHRKSGLRFTMRQAQGTVKHSKCSLSK